MWVMIPGFKRQELRHLRPTKIAIERQDIPQSDIQRQLFTVALVVPG
jgi:hypothetical protein